MNWCEDELRIFTIKNLKNKKKHEIGPYEDIDTSNLYKHMYHLGTPNKLKNMIYQMKKIHDKMKYMKKWNHQWMIVVYK